MPKRIFDVTSIDKESNWPLANNTVTISLENPPRNKENGTDTIRSNSNVTASLSLISS